MKPSVHHVLVIGLPVIVCVTVFVVATTITLILRPRRASTTTKEADIELAMPLPMHRWSDASIKQWRQAHRGNSRWMAKMQKYQGQGVKAKIKFKKVDWNKGAASQGDEQSSGGKNQSKVADEEDVGPTE
ncbi:uncharacterized protein LY89DRAFT_743708 [Mollisia scopiformis]|uniref:Uncharacterized protein n=1 Tax=Mollisia scopiformis TaxID=149040 RepID=A0A132B2T8_MOLSC|nr:uncharacterized protein LY89DRAFT_743708 [Mollisia scopiformis]KUJ06563.1 hypothetical protein LY89DRAFT_743708 [Mollisia scopiformis]